jgi:hypothetical protein
MDQGIDREFDRQLGVLLAKGYHQLAALSAEQFSGLLEPLRQVASSVVTDRDLETTSSRVPFVLVVSALLVPADELVPLTTLVGGSAPGVVDRNHGKEGLAAYQPLPELDVPEAPVYLLVDVQRGEEFCGVRPADALPTILARGRTPLTIHEGVAFVTQFPEVLEKNQCFMLSGSRRGDRRVPALWISGKAPKLGWCWEGNPHTWLGMASAGSRAA